MEKKHTKKSYIISLRRLLCFGLVLTLILSPSFSVFATDETSEEQSYEESLVNEASPPEAPPVQPSVSPESAEPKSAEPASEESLKNPRKLHLLKQRKLTKAMSRRNQLKSQKKPQQQSKLPLKALKDPHRILRLRHLSQK